jgi:hypothetical protein
METYQPLIAKIKELVGTNQTKKALDTLDQANLPFLSKDIIQLKARLRKLNDEQNLGILDDNSARLEGNKINLAVLGLLDKLTQQEEKKRAGGTGKNVRIFSFAFVGVLLIAAIGYWVIQSQPEKTNQPDPATSIQNDLAEEKEKGKEKQEELSPDKMKWDWAQSQNTTAAYESYLQLFPEGKHVQLAGDKISGLQQKADDQAWNLAVKVNTSESYQVYLEEFPQGSKIKEANQRQQELKKAADEKGWQQASKGNTPGTYQDYLTNFPDGKYKQEAENRMNRLITKANQERSDQDAWSKASRTDTEQGYKVYLGAFPNGKYVNDARSRIQAKQQEKKRAENAQRQIKVSLVKLYCEMSDDEGPGNDADMAEFRFTAIPTPGNCNPSSKEKGGSPVEVYRYTGERTTAKGYNWPLSGASAVVNFDNQACGKLRIKITGYAREADESSNDETANNSINIDLSSDGSFGKTQTFRLSSEDFKYRCEFRIDKVGSWKFGEKF